MFKKYLLREECDFAYAIVKEKDVEKLRGALRLIPGARKHGKNAIEIPDINYDPKMGANHFHNNHTHIRVLWPDGLRKIPDSAVKTAAAGNTIPLEYVWVYRQKIVDNYLKSLKK